MTDALIKASVAHLREVAFALPASCRLVSHDVWGDRAAFLYHFPAEEHAESPSVPMTSARAEQLMFRRGADGVWRYQGGVGGAAGAPAQVRPPDSPPLECVSSSQNVLGIGAYVFRAADTVAGLRWGNRRWGLTRGQVQLVVVDPAELPGVMEAVSVDGSMSSQVTFGVP